MVVVVVATALVRTYVGRVGDKKTPKDRVGMGEGETEREGHRDVKAWARDRKAQEGRGIDKYVFRVLGNIDCVDIGHLDVGAAAYDQSDTYTSTCESTCSTGLGQSRATGVPVRARANLAAALLGGN